MNNGRILGVKICFHSKKDRKELITTIINNNYFGFKPDIMEIDYNERNYDGDKALKLVQKSGRNTGVSFKNTSEDFEILIARSAIVTPPLTITLTIRNGRDFNYNDFVEKYVREKYFIVAYVYDFVDVKWQSENSISEYELNNKNHKNFLKIKDEWDDLVIDVSKNYGREVLLNNTWLMAVSKMWFSDLFFEITESSKTTLLSRPDVNEIGDGLVKVDLFGNIFSSEENRSKQKEFREFLDFEKIEKNLYPY